MGNEKKLEIMYEQFMELQQQVHLKNQRKIKVGLKINILLPLVFLIISFISNRSKLVFLVLWIGSLFGIAFYLLYVEYTDFKLQEQLKDIGIMEQEAETQALIGDEVIQSLDEMNNVRQEVKAATNEMVKDLREKREELKTEIKNRGDKNKNEKHN